jgi:hypothetical protein
LLPQSSNPDFGDVDPGAERVARRAVREKPQTVMPVTGAFGRFWHTLTIRIAPAQQLLTGPH